MEFRAPRSLRSISNLFDYCVSLLLLPLSFSFLHSPPSPLSRRCSGFTYCSLYCSVKEGGGERCSSCRALVTWSNRRIFETGSPMRREIPLHAHMQLLSRLRLFDRLVFKPAVEFLLITLNERVCAELPLIMLENACLLVYTANCMIQAFHARRRWMLVTHGCNTLVCHHHLSLLATGWTSPTAAPSSVPRVSDMSKRREQSNNKNGVSFFIYTRASRWQRSRY